MLVGGPRWSHETLFKNGERGRTYFFQCELPYDVPMEWGSKDYVGYRVAANVTEHNAYGAGVYHYFRDYPVVQRTGISVPIELEDRENYSIICII